MLMQAGAEAVAQGITAAGGYGGGHRHRCLGQGGGRRLFEETLARFGTLDVLVNNAGLTNTERHFLDGDEAGGTGSSR